MVARGNDITVVRHDSDCLARVASSLRRSSRVISIEASLCLFTELLVLAKDI